MHAYSIMLYEYESSLCKYMYVCVCACCSMVTNVDQVNSYLFLFYK